MQSPQMSINSLMPASQPPNKVLSTNNNNASHTVTIRLQNLPLSANASHIRRFFQGLSIPEGGVNIVGGPNGDAFIVFSSDEDGRKAMRLNKHPINDVPVDLLLSSRSEMESFIRETQMKMSQQQAPFAPAAPPASNAVPAPVTLSDSPKMDSNFCNLKSPEQQQQQHSQPQLHQQQQQLHEQHAPPNIKQSSQRPNIHVYDPPKQINSVALNIPQQFPPHIQKSNADTTNDAVAKPRQQMEGVTQRTYFIYEPPSPEKSTPGFFEPFPNKELLIEKLKNQGVLNSQQSQGAPTQPNWHDPSAKPENFPPRFPVNQNWQDPSQHHFQQPQNFQHAQLQQNQFAYIKRPYPFNNPQNNTPPNVVNQMDPSNFRNNPQIANNNSIFSSNHFPIRFNFPIGQMTLGFVFEFLRGANVVSKWGIKFEEDAVGRFTGFVYAMMVNVQGRDKALELNGTNWSLKHPINLPNGKQQVSLPIYVESCSHEEFDLCRSRNSKFSSISNQTVEFFYYKDLCVELNGIAKDSNENQIKEYLGLKKDFEFAEFHFAIVDESKNARAMIRFYNVEDLKASQNFLANNSYINKNAPIKMTRISRYQFDLYISTVKPSLSAASSNNSANSIHSIRYLRLSKLAPETTVKDIIEGILEQPQIPIANVRILKSTSTSASSSSFTLTSLVDLGTLKSSVVNSELLYRQYNKSIVKIEVLQSDTFNELWKGESANFPAESAEKHNEQDKMDDKQTIK